MEKQKNLGGKGQHRSGERGIRMITDIHGKVEG